MPTDCGKLEEKTMAEVIAIFDLEGTLCRVGGLLWRELIKRQIQHCRATAKVVAHILYQVLFALLYRLRLINTRRVRLTVTKDLASLCKGLNEKELEQLGEAISEKLVARLRPDIHAILEDHKRQAHKLVVTSGMFQPFLEALGRRLGVDLSVGTRLEERGGYYTGRLSGPVCFGEQRVSMLMGRILQAGLEVDLARSYAYGDTIGDKPVLEMVGNPVAVYPDVRLRLYAQKQGWKIVA